MDKKIGQKIDKYLFEFACWVLTLDLTISEQFYIIKKRIKDESKRKTKHIFKKRS